VTLPVAILAGGLATRMGDLTKKIPKALLDVAGKPFVVHQLELLQDELMREEGELRDVVLCVQHMGDQIEAVVGDGRKFGCRVKYSYDGDKLVGTGGAIKRALPLLGDEFFVMYGDSYLICDHSSIEQTYRASRKLGLMTVYENKGQYDASNVRYRDGEILAYDKTPGLPGMNYIDWGLGILPARAFDAYPADEKLDLATVYQDLLARGQLAAYEVHQRFYEIGSVEGLEDTRRLLSKEST
jgi:N-acetyl-alpha-D-muramate 1-phosphate uridylyltransferase